jgi:hypothetical protein
MVFGTSAGVDQGNNYHSPSEELAIEVHNFCVENRIILQTAPPHTDESRKD